MTRVASGPKNVSWGTGTPVLMGSIRAGGRKTNGPVMQPLEMVWILRFARRIDEYVIATFSSVAPWRRQLGQDREANGIGELPCPEALHHTRAMDLDRPHADAEIEGDHLVRASRQQTIENFPLARTK